MDAPAPAAGPGTAPRAAARPLSPVVAEALACVVVLAAAEARRHDETVAARLGLSRADLAVLLGQLPQLAPLVGDPAAGEDPAVSDEEDQVRLLLLLSRGEETDDTRRVACIMARRAMEADHLWQDMGLPSRAELGALIAEVFPALHARNTRNMRWKKFFYRQLCEREGFVLCAAPSCGACADYAGCFGPEDGESGLSRLRHGAH